MAQDPLSQIDPKYMVPTKGGKMHPTYPGVLEAAYRNGLIGLEAKVEQFPSEANGWTAVCSAIATFLGEDGRERVYAEVGDADPHNCTPLIVPHKIRMAATRAKGRALRDALGIGVALKEEIDGTSEDDLGSQRARSAVDGPSQSRPVARQQPRPQPDRNPGQEPVAPDDSDDALSRLVAEMYPPVGEAICAKKGCGSVLTLEEMRDCAREKLLRPCCAEHLLGYLKSKADTAKAS